LAPPRFHHQWSPDELFVESTMPPAIVDGLKAKGHAVTVGTAAGYANAVGFTFDGGQLAGAHDPRAAGKAAGSSLSSGQPRLRPGVPSAAM
jgi:gamma-glutamyltranspeptidase/glutathione hydrolase